MVAKGEYDLMANRSDRRLPTLVCVRAHQHEAGRMIRDSGARISIKATGATHAPDLVGRIYDRNLFPSAVAPPCTRAGSIYDTKKERASAYRFSTNIRLCKALLSGRGEGKDPESGALTFQGEAKMGCAKVPC